MLARIAFILALATLSGHALADVNPFDIRHMTFIAGEVGITDNLDDPQWFGIEFRGEPRTRWNLIPGWGVNFAANGAVYLFMDNRINWWLSDRVLFSLYSGPGLFKRSKDLDLGHTIEFRSGIEFSYRFDDATRFGISFAHMSNASLSSSNPGTNLLVLTYSRPR